MCIFITHLSKSNVRYFNQDEKSLKPGGIIYLSVKEGDGCRLEEGRLFQYYSSKQLCQTITQCQGLNVEELWRTIEIREPAQQVIWLNAIVRKDRIPNQK